MARERDAMKNALAILTRDSAVAIVLRGRLVEGQLVLEIESSGHTALLGQVTHRYLEGSLVGEIAASNSNDPFSMTVIGSGYAPASQYRDHDDEGDE